MKKPMRNPTPEQLLALVRGKLWLAVDPEYRSGAKRYFKGEINLYGVRAPELKSITGEAYATWKTWTRPVQNRFSNALWRSGAFEETTSPTPV